MAGVDGEGNVPLSVRTPAYNSAYYYPLKDGTNHKNRADHNLESAAHRSHSRYSNQIKSTMAADYFFLDT